MLIDHTNHRVLDVLEGREKSVLKAWLAAQEGLLKELEEVTTDMYDGYTMAVREVLGSRVRIVIDRFHVMKQFHQRLNDTRKQLQRLLPKGAAEALKGSRWLWLSNVENLSTGQQAELNRLKRQFPTLAALADHREQLRQIFNDRQIRTAAVGAIHLKAWCQRGRTLGFKALEPFYRMMENWMGKIANYFVSRSSNGPTEGFNRGLRALLWRACGMRNFEHFRLRVLHVFG